MKYRIAEKIIYRVPQFPIDAKLHECWDDLKASIALSSADFYKEIANVSCEDISILPTKLRLTIFKYFNRAKYRPVPFGTFAAVGLIDPVHNETSTIIKLESKQKAITFADWTFIETGSFDFDEIVKKNSFLFANSSYYDTPQGIRYVYKSEEGFELDDLDVDKDVMLILEFCRHPVRLNALLEYISMKYLGHSDTLLLIKEMIDAQLLFTSLSPNIIGEDYFTRIDANVQNIPNTYVIAERKYLTGNVDRKILRHLPALIDFLHRFNEPNEIPNNLKNFREQFIKRYDQMEIPIMQLLDPELGLGYGNLELGGLVSAHINELLDQQPLKPINEQDHIFRTLLYQFRNRSRYETIYLNQLEGLELPPEPKYQQPNSLSALITVSDGLVSIDQLGGYSTNQYAGRFSLASNEIHQYCREVAKAEQDANSDILFFDIGYISEIKVDNINRRQQIYKHQLTILNYDTSEEPITLDDIMVSMRNDEVILRSKTLNKRIIPRLATAYNHSRSDLSVYRFLCDLITKNLHTNLALDLTVIQPNEAYYPRIQYHNIIVSPAKWKLSGADYRKHLLVEQNNLASYLVNLGVSRFIKYGYGDQTLIIDTCNAENLELLSASLSNKDSFFAEEVLLPEDSIIQEKNGKSLWGQLLLNVFHQEKLYAGIHPKRLSSDTFPRIFIPGSQWLYYEIYCHPQRTDQLLQNQIRKFLAKHHGQINSWFFIRYNENGEHLRLRMQLHEPTYAGFLMKAFGEMITTEIQFGTISDVQVKTYKRELERYGTTSMLDAECHFSEDSKFVMALLNEDNLEDGVKYRISLSLFRHILQCQYLFLEEELISQFKVIYNGFTREHHLRSEAFKKLNNFVKLFRLSDELPLPENLCPQHTRLCESLERLIRTCPKDRRLNLLTDIMHMHVNRMFAQHQRTHEMVIYEILLSSIKREQAIRGQVFANNLKI